jgi:hypothetical protein
MQQYTEVILRVETNRLQWVTGYLSELSLSYYIMDSLFGKLDMPTVLVVSVPKEVSVDVIKTIKKRYKDYCTVLRSVNKK